MDASSGPAITPVCWTMRRTRSAPRDCGCSMLVNDRLDQANTLRYLTAVEHERLRTVNETAPGQHSWGRREDQVCLTLSAAPQIHHIDGIHRLLT